MEDGMGKLTATLFTSVLSFLSISCGSSNRLQSISISDNTTGPEPLYMASGTFTNGGNVSSLPVSWFIFGPGIDPPGTGYSLSAAPFLPVCVIGGDTYMIVAIAPADPHAPQSGPVPANVWNDLVSGKLKSESGFVGATVQMTCA